MKKSIIFFSVILSFNVNSQEVTNLKYGHGIYNVIAKDSSFSLKMGLRFQTLMVADWDVNDTSGFGEGNSEFLIRRARLKFDGFVKSPKLEYKIELGLSNRDIGKVDSRNNNAPNVILDAIIKWNFYKNFSLWAGQTKLPGNRERVISSSDLQFVDRSLLNNEFNIDRDMGVQLHHNFKIGKNFIVLDKFAFSQGEGRNLVQENLGGYQYTGRIELLPMGEFKGKGDYVGSDVKREAKPKLALGFTFDYNDRSVKDKSNQGSYMTYDLNDDGTSDGYFEATTISLFADFMFKYKGFSLMGEFSSRDSDKAKQSIINDDLSITTKKVAIGQGINIQAGYLLKNNWEISSRYTQITPGSILNKAQYAQYTLGFSRYIVEHKLKMQTDVNYLKTNNSPDGKFSLRIQFEVQF